MSNNAFYDWDGLHQKKKEKINNLRSSKNRVLEIEIACLFLLRTSDNIIDDIDIVLLGL